jgi:HEAT repeat protein
LTAAPSHVARRAAYALADCIDDPDRIGSAMTAEDDLVRQLAAMVLAEGWRPATTSSLRSLGRLALDPSPRVRTSALEAVGATSNADELVDITASCLSDRYVDVQTQALIALARMGAKAHRATGPVALLTRSENRHLREFARDALARTDPERSGAVATVHPH